MRKARKWAVLICILAMFTTTLAGCGGTPAPTATTAAVTTAAATTAAAATEAATTAAATTTEATTAAPTEAPKPPTTIVYKRYIGPETATDTFYKTAVGSVLLDKFNVKFEFLGSREDTYREELITDAATGSLPDLLTVWVYASGGGGDELKLLIKGGQEGLLAPLSAAIDKYAPTVKAAIAKENLPLYTQEWMYNPALNGEIYVIPHTLNAPDAEKTELNGWALFMRKDIAKQLNITSPMYFKTPDEFIKILRDIKALKPLDTNGKPIYPLGGIAQWGVLMSTYLRSFDWGGVNGVDLTADKKLAYFMNTDFAWNEVLFMRQLIKEKLIDPEALTQTFETGSEKIAQGKYAVIPMYAGGTPGQANAYMKALTSDHPEMEYDILGNMNTNKGNGTVVINVGMPTHFATAISSKANVDLLMPIIEYMQTPEFRAIDAYGKQGVTWDFDANGQAVLKPEFKQAYLNDEKDANGETFSVAQGLLRFSFLNTVAGIDKSIYKIFGGTTTPRYPLDPTMTDEVNRRLKLAYEKLEFQNKLNISYLMESFPQKDQLQPVMDAQKPTLMQCFLAGTESQAKKIFDDYKASLVKAGLDEYLAYLQKEYDANPDKYSLYITNVQ
jgi:putative aldouronate transport system substrate-binding protein